MRLIDADKLKMNFDIVIRDENVGCSFKMIDKQPTVDAEPVRHGKWIKEKPMIGGAYYRCSVCGNTENKHTAVKGHYCWFCGARME